MNESFFYVTTPIYYVNDEPHIGHTYTTLLADVFARYYRMRGYTTWFLTGTDEHGQKVEASAKKRNMTPLDHCNELSQRYKEKWKELNFSYDRFIRTTDDDHVALVQKMLQVMWDRGEIYADEYEGLYYVSDEIFVTQAQAEKIRAEKPSAEITSIKEKNYFFKMSQHIEWLRNYIETNPTFIQPDFRRNEVLGFLKQDGGVKDLCISRPKSRLTWGIELPFNREYVCYVWVDALLNYVSGAKWIDETKKEYWGLDAWKQHPADVHLIGKDILTTHCVYWPTLLHGMDLPLPKTIFAHGWWLISGEKMSKSLGNVIRPKELIDALDGDVSALKYLLLRGMVLGQDATLTEDRMKAIVNGELANDLGNLFSRVMKLVETHFQSELPMREMMFEHPKLTPDSLYSIHEFLDQQIERIRTANKLFDSNATWALVKQDKQKAAEVLITCLNELKTVAYALASVAPEKMNTLLNVFGVDSSTPYTPFQGGKLQKLDKPLFPRIDFDKKFDSTHANNSEKKSKIKDEKPSSLPVGLVSIDDVRKIELKTAIIREAEPIEGAKKLLKLQVDDGSPQGRQIVAGIAEYFEPSQLLNQTIVIVANLLPVKLKGVESNGMLLAAKNEGKLVLVTIAGNLPAGSSIS